MDDDEEQCRVGLGQYRKKSGQKTCAHCSKSYNNYSIPPYCTCNFFLGGTFKKAVQKLDTKMLTSTLASTRVNIAGPNIRTFVLLGDNPKARISIINSLYFPQFMSKSQLNPCSGFITQGKISLYNLAPFLLLLLQVTRLGMDILQQNCRI